MRIAIMGSGGIGGYIGAKLARAGEDVTFISRGSHLTAMQEQGLCVESPLGAIKLPHVSASDRPGDVGSVDVVIFAVKLYDSETAAAEMVPLVGPTTRVVTLQNGIDSVATLAHSDIKTTMRYAHLEEVQVSQKARDVINRISNGNLLPSDQVPR